MKRFLYQPTNGYCYNSDTIFLYDFIRTFKLKGNVLDVGSGVGILTILLATEFKANFFAVEKQEIMYRYALKNFKLNRVKVDIKNIEFQQYKSDIKFDYIVSNPPFYKVDRHQSPNIIKNIARYEHHLPLNSLIEKVSKLLKPRGYFIFCYDAWQIDDVLKELKEHKINPEFLKFVHPKANKEANIAIIASRKNSNSRCKIEPPLIVFDNNNNYTNEALEAFKLANTHSIKADYDF